MDEKPAQKGGPTGRPPEEERREEDRREDPRAEDLAQRFLDLWLDQVSALAQDRTLIGHVGTLLRGLRETQAQMALLALGAADERKTGDTDDGAERHDGRAEREGEAARAAPAAAPRELGGLDLYQLLDRLEAVEKRLERLESDPGGAGSKPQPSSRGGGKPSRRGSSGHRGGSGSARTP